MPQVVKMKNGEAQSSGGVPIAMPRPLSRLGEYPRRFRQFLHEVRNEMRLVTWPTRLDVFSTTIVVILTTILFAAFLWLVDISSFQLITRVTKIFLH